MRIGVQGMLPERMIHEMLMLRPATMEDADILLEWRNEQSTRAASHNTDEVNRDEHISRMSMTINSKDRMLYVAEENGIPVGSVRAYLDGGVWELSWTISPESRGRGLAKLMVSIFANEIPGPIKAEIKSWNILSIRVAENAGMVFEIETDGILYYKRAAKR